MPETSSTKPFDPTDIHTIAYPQAPDETESTISEGKIYFVTVGPYSPDEGDPVFEFNPEAEQAYNATVAVFSLAYDPKGQPLSEYDDYTKGADNPSESPYFVAEAGGYGWADFEEAIERLDGVFEALEMEIDDLVIN